MVFSIDGMGFFCERLGNNSRNTWAGYLNLAHQERSQGQNNTNSVENNASSSSSSSSSSVNRVNNKRKVDLIDLTHENEVDVASEIDAAEVLLSFKRNKSENALPTVNSSNPTAISLPSILTTKTARQEDIQHGKCPADPEKSLKYLASIYEFEANPSDKFSISQLLIMQQYAISLSNKAAIINNNNMSQGEKVRLLGPIIKSLREAQREWNQQSHE
jgi:hypothetical protein